MRALLLPIIRFIYARIENLNCTFLSTCDIRARTRIIVEWILAIGFTITGIENLNCTFLSLCVIIYSLNQLRLSNLDKDIIMTIKKAYIDIIALLEANKSKKVSTILEEVTQLASSKVATKTFRTNEAGEVTEIFCYYHKEWELVSEHEYGAKASSATGLNSMCKVGVNAWTKQQRVAKQEKEELLMRVASGEVEPANLTDELAKIEATRTSISL